MSKKISESLNELSARLISFSFSSILKSLNCRPGCIIARPLTLISFAKIEATSAMNRGNNQGYYSPRISSAIEGSKSSDWFSCLCILCSPSSDSECLSSNAIPMCTDQLDGLNKLEAVSSRSEGFERGKIYRVGFERSKRTFHDQGRVIPRSRKRSPSNFEGVQCGKVYSSPTNQALNTREVDHFLLLKHVISQLDRFQLLQIYE